jgi:hypothetical protein
VRQARVWIVRALMALLLAVGTNAVLSASSVEHDPALVALLVVAVVAAFVLAMTALESDARVGWTVRRGDARPGTGEDTRTSTYRHVIEVHLTSLDADDTVVWRIADLAKVRLRQLYGVRPEESPERTTELVGPVLAEWMSHDRRHRYLPDTRHRRYSVAELGEVVRRIEEL